jgi:4-amino-4-deoxy-L-arabinose transferase-like glycosyltransferase
VRPSARLGEAAALCVVFGVAIGVRLAKLGTVPRIITADETDNLQTAYHILTGTGPGIFGFDWKPAPIFSLYPLAWTVRIFGDSVTGFRLFPVITSLLTMVLFYVVARRAMRAPAALGALLLLGTNLWFLHFSRTAWENGNAALFAIGACWTTTRAIETGRRRWWVLAGVFVALGAYGYFTGRFIFVAVVLTAAFAVAFRQADWRPTVVGLGVAGVIAAALFAPMAKSIADDWHAFNRRTRNVSVFDTQEPYYGDTNGWIIAAKNVPRNLRGFILQDGSQVGRGLWTRYNPPHRAPLDLGSAALLWCGLVAGALRWRKTYGWWTFFAPLFIAQVFSRGTPDLARGVLIAPFYFLFIGVAFDELLRVASGRIARALVWSGLIAAITYLSVTNVRDYFSWQTSAVAESYRMPGVDYC